MGMNIPNHISESLVTIFWVTILKFFDADPDSGSGIFLTLDPGWEKFGSGINIWDPQHRFIVDCQFEVLGIDFYYCSGLADNASLLYISRRCNSSFG
jgi:hypothetical protein